MEINTQLVHKIQDMTETKDLFGLGLNGSPDLSRRIAYGAVGEVDENMTFTQLFDLILEDSNTYSKDEVNTLLENYLSKTNLAAYTPTLETHPATKGYVDGGGVIVAWTNCVAATNVTLIDCKASQIGKHVYITGKFSVVNPTTGMNLLTIPSSIGTSTKTIYGTSSIKSSNTAALPLRLDANTRVIKLTDGGNSGIEYKFQFNYPAI